MRRTWRARLTGTQSHIVSPVCRSRCEACSFSTAIRSNQHTRQGHPMTFALETDEMDEAYDEALDESDEAYDEALPRIPRPGARPVPTAGRQSAYRPRPNNNFVTQTQLQAA